MRLKPRGSTCCMKRLMNSVPGKRKVRFLPPVHPDAERHRTVVDAEDALIGDRHPMGVTAQILEHLRRTAEGLLGIDHPVMQIQLVLQLTPSRVGQRGVFA